MIYSQAAVRILADTMVPKTQDLACTREQKRIVRAAPKLPAGKWQLTLESHDEVVIQILHFRYVGHIFLQKMGILNLIMTTQKVQTEGSGIK